MPVRGTHRRLLTYFALLLGAGVLLCVLGFFVFHHSPKGLRRTDFIASIASGVKASKDARSELLIPRITGAEEGPDEGRMWRILFKSKTAYRAEMKAREQSGGRSPFIGRTSLNFSCFYPTSRKIRIPADLSDTRAALAYAYELKHFEQAGGILDLQAQVASRAISASQFADRCMELEARAAYQEVRVARELRKAWVLGAYSEWEAFCRPGEGERKSISRILAVIHVQGIVPGTGKTARDYYLWLAARKLEKAEPARPALPQSMAAAP